MHGAIEIRDNFNYLLEVFYTSEPKCFIEATSFHYHILMLMKEASNAITMEDQEALDIVHARLVSYIGE